MTLYFNCLWNGTLLVNGNKHNLFPVLFYRIGGVLLLAIVSVSSPFYPSPGDRLSVALSTNSYRTGLYCPTVGPWLVNKQPLQKHGREIWAVICDKRICTVHSVLDSLSALLTFCAGNSPITSGFPAQKDRNVLGFIVSSIISSNKLLNK